MRAMRKKKMERGGQDRRTAGCSLLSLLAEGLAAAVCAMCYMYFGRQ